MSQICHIRLAACWITTLYLICFILERGLHAQVVKEGQCPRATPRPSCPTEGKVRAVECENDDVCDGNMKCCHTECPWKQCKDPVKKGACPELSPGFCPRSSSTNTSDTCTSDLGCDGRLKCCPSKCSGLQCTEPNMEKEGICPDVLLSDDDDILEGLVCKRECDVDYDCDSNKKCCFNGCTMTCL